VIEGKARQIGAVDCYLVDAREEFAGEYIARAIKCNALYGGGYRCSRAWPAVDRKARRRLRAARRLRHDRPRLHRQGQRSGSDRGDVATLAPS